MEEDSYDPSEVNSFDVNNILHASIVYMNKKRKLQAEQLGLPLSKHNCCDRGFTSELGSPSNIIQETEGYCTVLIKGRTHGGEGDGESELESGNGSNNFAEDADSIMSVSGGAKTFLQDWNTCSVDQPSTPSVNWAGNCYKSSLYSLDNRSLKKSSINEDKSPFTDGVHNHPHYDIDSPASLNYEQLLQYENNVDYSFSDHGDDSTAQCTDEDLQDLLYSGAENQKNFVLSSGRWDVSNQESHPATEKLTIDKEFEQYFSTLML